MHALPTSAIVGVIGAGAMGAGIAQVAAQAGHIIKLYDNRPGAAAQAIAKIRQQWDRMVEKGKLDTTQRTHLQPLLLPCDELTAMADSSLIIEAIVENLEIKRNLFAQLETVCNSDCILSSNTSSISITSLAAKLKHPERLIGLHFFNPAPLMALVEIVSGLASDKNLAQCLYETTKNWGKKPVHTRSTPGFIVNRVARPFYAESLRLLQEGAADCATLDALMREAGGFRMGAFELMDLIGHDVNYAVTCSVFHAYYGDFRFQPSLIQKELVDAGYLGRKSGCGFYDYTSKANAPEPVSLDSTISVTSCIIEGDLGIAQPLVERMQQHGILIESRPGPGLIRTDNAVLALTDGRMACQRQQQDHLNNLAIFDLALNYSQTTRLGIAFAADMEATAREQAIALFKRIGITVSPLTDSPALAIMRTVVMLANEAADATLQGVGSATDIDLAMCAGVNYPLGPMAWANRIGLDSVLHVLSNLQASYGEDRYRPSLLLQRLAAQRSIFHV